MDVRRALVVGVAAAGFTCMLAGTAAAIPAFSRQYKAECTTCHTVFPELNEYGEAFRKNAYVYPGKSPADMEKESQAAQQPKNEALWLSGIPEQLPLSLTATIDAAYDRHSPSHDNIDLSTRALMLNAGGTFRDKAGFFAEYVPYSQGTYDPLASNVPLNNAPNLGELFIMWRHAFDTPINVKAGRFRPQLSLWKSSNRATVSTLATQNFTAGRSTFAIDSPEDGLEVNSIIGSRVFAAGGIVDRNGQNTKEGYGHLSVKFGGADFLGHEPVVDLDTDSVWDYLSITAGVFGYFGSNASLDGLTADRRNHFYRAGVDLDAVYKAARIRFSGMKGRDADPLFADSGERKSTVLAAEGEYQFFTGLEGIFRYEFVNGDDFVGSDSTSGIIRRYIPAIAYTPLQNTKLVLEYRYEDAPTATNRVAVLGASFSF